MLTKEQVFEIMQTGQPLSLIRAGDGEQIVLQSNQSIEDYETCVNVVMKRQLGFEPTMTEVTEIRNNLIEAYKNADIIGLPNQTKLKELNKYWQAVGENIKSFCTTDKFTYTDISYDLLTSGLLYQWLQDKKTLNFISCRSLAEKLSARFNIKQVNGYIIEPEAKFSPNTGNSRHYPDQFRKVERFMTKCEIQGMPCLVGAGVVGKIYCNWFRDRGGIAIDIGAVFDLWAGLVTRGPARGRESFDRTYKL